MLTLDYANCLSTRVGPHGLDPKALAPGSPAAKAAADLTARLAKSKGTGWERWRLLPFAPMRTEHTRAVHEVVERCRGKFDTMVVMGIGGSALGNIALQSALNPATYNVMPASARKGPRVFVVDNVDPAYFGSVLKFVLDDDPSLENTLFHVISKSGETAETAAQFMSIRSLLIEKLGKERHKDHIVAVTDPEKGTMRQICNANGYATLPVPEGVGGRFSVLSPVGLFSAAMAGIDIEALLDGAAAMDGPCTNPDLAKNPAAMLATVLVHLAKTEKDGGPRGDTSGAAKSIHVMMPYANGLYLLADWFRQLWAESLGKRFAADGKTEVFAGYTPVKALGTTDQHSQVQLYREGPNDKVFGFVEVADFGEQEMAIPTGLGVEAIRYLEGKTFGGLLNAEKRATEFAFVESQRPNFTITFPKVDAFHVGQFLYLWEMVTAYAGAMLGIDSYDQPAVETGKVATFGLMGRAGYEEWKTKVEKALGKTGYVI
jgi:glucose-6-phosphate isomerase